MAVRNALYNSIVNGRNRGATYAPPVQPSLGLPAFPSAPPLPPPGPLYPGGISSTPGQPGTYYIPPNLGGPPLGPIAIPPPPSAPAHTAFPSQPPAPASLPAFPSQPQTPAPISGPLPGSFIPADLSGYPTIFNSALQQTGLGRIAYNRRRRPQQRVAFPYS